MCMSTHLNDHVGNATTAFCITSSFLKKKKSLLNYLIPVTVSNLSHYLVNYFYVASPRIHYCPIIVKKTTLNLPYVMDRVWTQIAGHIWNI